MKRVRLIAGLLTAALIAASFAGCGEKSESQDVSAMKQEQGQKPPQGQRGIMAKVVSLDGDQLTVILSGMPDGGGYGSRPPEDGQAPANGGNPPAPPDDRRGPASGPAIDGSGAPSGGPGAPSGGPGQPGQPGEGGGKIEFTGEQVTYTLSDNVAVMKGAGDHAAEIDLSELKTDDVIRFTAEADEEGSEVISTIIVM